MKYCFLIPVHPPKFYYIYQVLNNPEIIPFDIFLVFTNRQEYKTFDSQYFSEKVRPIIFDELYDMATYTDYFENSNSWINVKKLIGLKYLFENYTQYSGVLVVDSEISFLNKSNFDYISRVNTAALCKKIFGYIWNENAGAFPIIRKVISYSMDLLPGDYKYQLVEETYDRKFLSFFANIPIYHKIYWKEFLEMIGDDFFLKLTYHTFDYVIYSYFLRVKNYAQFISIPSPIDCCSDIGLFKEISSKYPVLWVYNQTYEKDKYYFDQHNKIFMRFALDRKT